MKETGNDKCWRGRGDIGTLTDFWFLVGMQNAAAVLKELRSFIQR